MYEFTFGDVVYLDDGNHLWSVRACYPHGTDIVRGVDGKLLNVHHSRLTGVTEAVQDIQGQRLLNVAAVTR